MLTYMLFRPDADACFTTTNIFFGFENIFIPENLVPTKFIENKFCYNDCKCIIIALKK